MYSFWLNQAFLVTLAIVSVELQGNTIDSTEQSQQTVLTSTNKETILSSTDKSSLTATPEAESTTISGSFNILDYIFQVFGPTISALLILILTSLLVFILLTLAVVLIRKKCRTRRISKNYEITLDANTIKDTKEECSGLYSVVPTNALGIQKEEGAIITVTPDRARETCYSDDFDETQEKYLNMDELKSETMEHVC
jgi:hypothetical protein